MSEVATLRICFGETSMKSTSLRQLHVEAVADADLHLLFDEVVLLVEDGVRLGDDVLLLFVGGEIDDLVRDVGLHGDRLAAPASAMLLRQLGCNRRSPLLGDGVSLLGGDGLAD